MGKVSDNGERADVDGSEKIYLYTPGQDWTTDLNNIIGDLDIVQLDDTGKVPAALLPDAVTPSGGGDVTGPSSVTDSRVALWDGTSGNVLKQGTAAQLVPTGGANGQFLGHVAGTPAWVAAAGDVRGPSGSVTDGLPVLWNGTTAKDIKAGVAGQFVPAGGTSGQVLAKSGAGDYATTWVDQSGGGGITFAAGSGLAVSGTTTITYALDAGTVASLALADAALPEADFTGPAIATALTTSETAATDCASIVEAGGEVTPVIADTTLGVDAAGALECRTAGAQRAWLSLVPGSDVQAYSTTLTALESAYIPASASGPAAFLFNEDTDEGVQTLRLEAPLPITTNYTVTLPGAATELVGASVTANLTVGYTVTSFNVGTFTAGTALLAIANGQLQRMTLNGSGVTLTMPTTGEGSITLIITMGASAAPLTLSGVSWTIDGDPLAYTAGAKFLVQIMRIDGDNYIQFTQVAA